MIMMNIEKIQHLFTEKSLSQYNQTTIKFNLIAICQEQVIRKENPM